MGNKNIEILNETIKIIRTGWYPSQKKKTVFNRPAKIKLKLTKAQMSETIVLSDKQVQQLVENPPYDGPFSMGGRCRVKVSNIDSFAAAVNMTKEYLFKADREKLLVLNFANPVEPGGGVRRGAKAQEEDLCRKSTLLASLESDSAKEMYRYNRTQSFVLSSDYMILTPNVEIFRDENNDYLKETVVVSVLTAAAPYVSQGTDGIGQEEIERVFCQRIMGVLQVATT